MMGIAGTKMLLDSPLYRADVRSVAELDLPWGQLQDSSIAISGATGLIGKFLIDVLMERNASFDQRCAVVALGRSEAKAQERFSSYWTSRYFRFVACDVTHDIPDQALGEPDFILHAASATHPLAYANEPVSTITANVIGLNNLLAYATSHHVQRFAFASSNEVYGQNRGDVAAFDESYCGYIDSNTLRAGYPESKRTGEALCQAYMRQYGMDVVIPRFTRSFGPTMLMSDSKAMSQFIKNGLHHEDIVLKSAGTQYYSYTYVADAVSGLLACLLLGDKGEAYNIATPDCDTTLAQAAQTIAELADVRVVFEIPDEIERAGYSTATRAILNPAKLESLDWRAAFNLETGLRHTLEILGSKE